MNIFNKERKRVIPLVRSLSAILLTAAFMVTLSGCFMLPEDEETMAPPVVLKDPVAQKITTEKVRRGSIENKVKFWGSFMSPDQINLSFPGTGILGAVNVKYGDSVKAGDVLAKLESDDLDLQLAQLKISFQKAKLNYESLKKKNEASKGGLKYEVEDARLSMEAIELDINNIKEKLTKISVISPIDGIVNFICPLNLGQMVAAKADFITLCDPKNMVLVVKESEVQQPIPAGQEVTINYNGKLYQGKVLKTPEDNINEENADFVSAYTINTEGLDIKNVKMNDTASIEYVISKADDVLLIDKSYIRKDGDKSFVSVYKDGVIEDREVEKGMESDNGIDIEIKKGLTETDEILVP